jgi:hypothetical protein
VASNGYRLIVSVDVLKVFTWEKEKSRDFYEKTHYPFDIPPYFSWMCDHERNTTTRVWGKTRCFLQSNPEARPLTDGNMGDSIFIAPGVTAEKRKQNGKTGLSTGKKYWENPANLG